MTAVLASIPAGTGTLPRYNYLSSWNGIDNTGGSDSGAAFASWMSTLSGSGVTGKVDCPVYIQILLDWTKMIQLPNNIHIEFTDSGKIITDGIGVPTFYGTHWQHARITNMNIEYIGDMGDLGTNFSGGSSFHTASGNVNDVTIKSDLIARFGNTFVSGSAVYPGPTNQCSIIRLTGDCRKVYFDGTTKIHTRDWSVVFSGATSVGGSNTSLASAWAQTTGIWYVTMSNDQIIQMLLTNGSTTTSNWSTTAVAPCTINATGVNPAYFIPCAVSLDAQWVPGLTGITSGTAQSIATIVAPTDVNFYDVELDGFCMGWVGTPWGGEFRNIVCNRYSDLMDSYGFNIGGDITLAPTWFAPPHMFYLKSLGITGIPACNVKYGNIDDKGTFIGPPARRDFSSGFTNGFKWEPAGGTSINGYRSMRPDGAFDCLSNGYSGGTAKGCYVDMYTYKQSYHPVTLTAVVGSGDTTATLTGNWPYKTQSYTITFSNRITRTVTLTNGATTISSFAALGTAATATIVVTVDPFSAGGANFAVRFPSASAVVGLDMDITVYDRSNPPGGHPILSDNGQGHTNVIMRSKETVQDYPPGATWQPGYIIAGAANEVDSTIIYNNCQSTQTGTGACFIQGAATLQNSVYRYRIVGWRQVVLTFTGSLSGATSGTLLSNFVPASGTYRVIFSDGSERAVTLAQGATTASWSGVVTAGVTANCNLVIASTRAALTQRVQIQGGSGAGALYNSYAEVNDVSNGILTIVESTGYARDRWVQRQRIESVSGATIASNLSVISNFAVEAAVFNPIVNFGTTGGLTGIELGYTGTPAAFQPAEPIATGSDSSVPTAAPISLAGNLTTTRNVLLTAVGGTFDGTGVGILTIAATRSYMAT